MCLHNCHAAVIETAEGSPGHEVDGQHEQLVELSLHRGTSYGRGISTLSDTDPEVIELKKYVSIPDDSTTDRPFLGAIVPDRHVIILTHGRFSKAR